MKPSLSTAPTAHSLSGIALRNQIAAATLLAFIFCVVVGALLLLDVEAPYAFAAGVIVAALVKADDARIRRTRRRSAP